MVIHGFLHQMKCNEINQKYLQKLSKVNHLNLAIVLGMDRILIRFEFDPIRGHFYWFEDPMDDSNLLKSEKNLEKSCEIGKI